MQVPEVDPLDQFLHCVGIFFTVKQTDDFLKIRPVNTAAVKVLCEYFQNNGYMHDAGKITVVHTSGDLGGDNARYGLVNGHHRVTALRREQASGRMLDFRVSAYPRVRHGRAKSASAAAAHQSRRSTHSHTPSTHPLPSHPFPFHLSSRIVHQHWVREQRRGLPDRRLAA